MLKNFLKLTRSNGSNTSILINIYTIDSVHKGIKGETIIKAKGDTYTYQVLESVEEIEQKLFAQGM